MRKLILLAGTALMIAATPASACDFHTMGGLQRFSAFAAYASNHPLTSRPAEPTEAQPEQRQAEPQAQPIEPANAPAEAPSDDAAAPAPAATFR